MPALRGSEVARTRSRIAVATRCGTLEDVTAARRDHATATLADHIQRVVAEAPDLSPQQLDRLAALLRPAAGGASR